MGVTGRKSAPYKILQNRTPTDHFSTRPPYRSRPLKNKSLRLCLRDDYCVPLNRYSCLCQMAKFDLLRNAILWSVDLGQIAPNEYLLNEYLVKTKKRAGKSRSPFPCKISYKTLHFLTFLRRRAKRAGNFPGTFPFKWKGYRNIVVIVMFPTPALASMLRFELELAN